MEKEIKVVKNDGSIEVFDEKKLERSLRRSGADKVLIGHVLEHIRSILRDHMATKEIYQKAFAYLKHSSKTTALRYSLKKAVMDLGPTGFPFEKLLAEVFKVRGYKTEIGRVVMGRCTEHEVDVIAYNNTEVIVIEAKFHNMLGTKSDLKDVLYVKSRIDDLKNNTIEIEGKEREVTDGWLVTNTKFTHTAKQYARCTDMTLIGWGYPEKGNLQDMIESTSVHPVTCLTTLTSSQEKALIDKGNILCNSVNVETLKSVGISGDKKVDAVLNEVKVLC